MNKLKVALLQLSELAGMLEVLKMTREGKTLPVYYVRLDEIASKALELVLNAIKVGDECVDELTLQYIPRMKGIVRVMFSLVGSSESVEKSNLEEADSLIKELEKGLLG